jgi:hypothetical protein
MNPSQSIELLTADVDGHAIQGPQYPEDRGGAIYWIGENDPDSRRLAYRHKFFRYDEHRQPMPETLVEFYVPDFMLESGFPGRLALRLVAERMGWDEH